MENTELESEVEAINATYEGHTLQPKPGEQGLHYVLTLPDDSPVRLNVAFPPEYPQKAPVVVDTHSTAGSSRRGYGAHVVRLARGALGEVFVAGQICLYDFLERLLEKLVEEGSADSSSGGRPLAAAAAAAAAAPPPPPAVENVPHSDAVSGTTEAETGPADEGMPELFVSETVTEKRSVFTAQACAITSPSQARRAYETMIASSSRMSKATHNVLAFRCREVAAGGPAGPEILHEDCDDDGEDAAGGRLLHLLKVVDAVDVMVVVSRWYGGVKLGPDRFRIINQVARGSLMAGGWIKNIQSTSKAKKK